MVQGATTKVMLGQVKITSTSPYLHIGQAGAKFAINRTFWLGGAPSSTAGIAFKVTQGELLLTDVTTNPKYAIAMTANVNVMLGGQQTNNVGGTVKLTVKDGNVKADIIGANIAVAGVELRVDKLKYENDLFTATNAKLTLPRSWGFDKATMAISGLKIDKSGVRWDSWDTWVSYPGPVTLGSVLELKGMQFKLTVNAKSEYELLVKGTVTVRGVDLRAAQAAGTHLYASEVQGFSTTFEVRVDKSGKVTGTVVGFSLELIGMKVTISEARWNDDTMFIREAEAKFPAALGNGGFKLHGLTIGGSKGFEVKGGRFDLPNISFAGIGVKKAFGEFQQLPDGRYSIAAGAELDFATFGIAGRFKLEMDRSGTMWLRQVYIKFSGQPPAAIGPLDGTGLYITEIWGQFDVGENQLEISFGLAVETPGKFAGATLVRATGSVKLTLQPNFRLTTSAELYLIGWRLAKAEVVISDRGFSVDAELRLAIVKVVGYLAFGLDSDDEFTLAAGVKVWLEIEANAVCTLIPPVKLSLGPIGAEVGKFRRDGQKIWGAQAFMEIVGLGVYGFAGFSPLKLDAGLGSSPYQIVRPDFKQMQELASGPGRDVLLVDVVPSRQVAFVEQIHPLNWENPDPLILTLPDGSSLTPTPSYEHRAGDVYGRVYILDRPQVGRWTVDLQTGNTILVVGTDPEPELTIQVEQLEPGKVGVLSVRKVEGSPARIFGDERPSAHSALHALRVQRPLRLSADGTLRITWSSSDVANVDEPQDVEVELYAEDDLGKRWPIATSDSLNGVYDWQPALPSGVYTFTVAAIDGRNMPVISQVLFDYQDTVPPAPPEQLDTHVHADGTVDVAWDSTTADPDTWGYVVSLGTGQSFTVTHPINSYTVSGLQPAEMLSIGVASYDMSYNVGDPTIVSVRGPELMVAGMYPASSEVVSITVETQVAFNQPVQVTGFTLEDSEGQPVEGSVLGLTYDLGAILPTDEPVWGTRFRPARGWLEPGTYTAEVTAVVDGTTAQALQQVAGLRAQSLAPAGMTSTYRWSFTVTDVPTWRWLPLL
jgi:hypothetical protein